MICALLCLRVGSVREDSPLEVKLVGTNHTKVAGLPNDTGVRFPSVLASIRGNIDGQEEEEEEESLWDKLDKLKCLYDGKPFPQVTMCKRWLNSGSLCNQVPFPTSDNQFTNPDDCTNMCLLLAEQHPFFKNRCRFR